MIHGKTSFMLCTLLLATLGAASSTQPADVTTAIKAGTGVALIEVTAVKEVDGRPADGNLVDQVSFKIIQTAGEIPSDITIVKDFGGRRAGPAPKPSGPLYPNPLVAGQRYWVVFNTADGDKYPQGVVAWWPQKDAPTDALEAAVKAGKP